MEFHGNLKVRKFTFGLRIYDASRQEESSVWRTCISYKGSDKSKGRQVGKSSRNPGQGEWGRLSTCRLQVKVIMGGNAGKEMRAR